jgi:hypothetical protein
MLIQRFAIVVAVALAGTAPAAQAAPSAEQVCRAAKLGAAAKSGAALLKCSAIAAASGAATEAECVEDALTRLAEAFTAADLKAGVACGFDDVVPAAVLATMRTEVEAATPAPTGGGKCPSSERKATGKLLSSRLKAFAKFVKSADSAKRDAALDKAASKFDAAMLKAEAAGDCAAGGQGVAAESAVSTAVTTVTTCLVDLICSSPVTDSIMPSAGSMLGGTTVTISGNSFAAATGVSFGGAPAASFTIVSPTTIEAVTAGGTPGPAAVTVANAMGTGSGQSFSYDCSGFSLTPADDVIETSGGSTVSFDIQPHSVPPGVTLEYDWDCVDDVATGTAACAALAAATGPAVDVSVVDAMLIRVQPSIRVLPANTVCSPFDEVTVRSLGSPSVGSISPTTGSFFGGTTVTITGTNFAGVTGVTFGGTPATSFNVVSPTEIEAVTAGGVPTAMTVAVETMEGTGSGPAFTYDCSELYQHPEEGYVPVFGGSVTIEHPLPKPLPPGLGLEWYWECDAVIAGAEACDHIRETTGPTVTFETTPDFWVNIVATVMVTPGSWETTACRTWNTVVLRQ